MVKTTYALTLFAAVSLAAPVPSTGIEYSRRDGTGNLIGAGTADGAVNEMVKGLATPSSDHPSSLDKPATEKQPQQSQPSILESVPLVGPLLRPVPLKRSFTGDLSNFPILASIFGGNQAHPANSPNQEGGGQKPNILRDLSGLPQNYGQNYEQNYGQNYEQNAGQNAGQNDGQNEGQNEGQNMRRDLTGDLHDLPIVGELLSSKDQHGSNKQSRQLHGIAQLLQGLTASGPETVSHKRDEIEEPDYDGLISDAESAADSASGLAGDFMNVKARQVTDVADTITGALDRNVNQEADLTDSLKLNRRVVPGTRQTAPVSSGSQTSDQQSNSPLKQIASETGLGALFANSHHGLGLLPMERRDVHEHEARGGAPIQGSDLPSVLFSGGVLGKLAQSLKPAGL